MKRFTIIAVAIFSVLILSASISAQTPVPMSSQPGLSYTENFADIANWTNGFAAGTGANRFGAVAVNATGTIPDGVRTTVSSATFATSATTGGIQRGSLAGNPAGTIVMLSTGTTDNSNAVAFDFLMDFTGVNAGTLSFDWATVNNSTGNRNSSLRVYWSTNGTTFTEIPAAQVLNFTNNVASSGTVSTVALPSAFNNNPNARLRFYEYNGTGGTTGSRPKVSIDNLNVTATAIPVPPNLSINDVSVNEGNSGTTTFTFTVSLSANAPAGGVTFDIATTDGTATTADSDYVQKSLTSQTIPAGSSSYTFDVSVNGDTTVETNETFFVNVTNVTGAVVTDGQGQGTIQNDDVTPPVVAFDSSSYLEDESQTLTVNVIRTGDLSGMTTVNYSTRSFANNFGNVAAANGGASCTLGVDYITASGTLTFNSDEDVKSFEVQLCGDLLDESTESFGVELSNVVNGALGEPSQATANINDTASQFSNTNFIGFGAEAFPYPAPLTVSGAPTTISGLRVTLYDFSDFNPDDIDVLLVGPQGQNILLMADAGGSGFSGGTLTFQDNAGRVVPNGSALFDGKFEPTSWEPGQASFPAPAPAAPYNEPGSTVGGEVTLASVFGGANPNGTWNLYVRIDNGAFQQVGIRGGIGGGWGLQFIAPTAAGVSVSGQVRSGKTAIPNTTVMITGGNLTQPVFAKTNSFGNYTFEGLAAGQTFVVTVVSNRYNFPQSSIVLNLEDNIAGADFEAEER